MYGYTTWCYGELICTHHILLTPHRPYRKTARDYREGGLTPIVGSNWRNPYPTMIQLGWLSKTNWLDQSTRLTVRRGPHVDGSKEDTFTSKPETKNVR
jgi:hypothetical protein